MKLKEGNVVFSSVYLSPKKICNKKRKEKRKKKKKKKKEEEEEKKKIYYLWNLFSCRHVKLWIPVHFRQS